MLGTSPDGAHPGLHRNLLDAAIRECLRRIAPAAAMVLIAVKKKNANKTQLLASQPMVDRSQNRENFVPQNKPSTNVIDATSFITM